MTNVTVNAFAAAMSSRIDYETTKAKLSASNMKKLHKATLTLSMSSVAELLTTCNVDASILNRQVNSEERFAVYNIERFARLAYEAAHQSAIDNSVDAFIFKTMKLHAKAKKMMLQTTAQQVLSNKHTFDKSMQRLVFQNSKDYDTEVRQSQITLAAFCALDVLRKSFDDKRNVAYAINDESEIFKRLAANN